MEETFFQLEVEVVELCHFENVMNCSLVIFEISSSGDTDVVHVDADHGAE